MMVLELLKDGQLKGRRKAPINEFPFRSFWYELCMGAAKQLSRMS